MASVMFSAAGPLPARVKERWIVSSCTSEDALQPLPFFPNSREERQDENSPVGRVVLDSKVVVGSSGVVRSGQEDTSVGLVRPDDVRDGGSGEDGVVSDDELGDAVTGGETDDGLDGLSGEEPTVTSDDEGLACGTVGDGGKGGLDEVLGVVLRRKCRGRKRASVRWTREEGRALRCIRSICRLVSSQSGLRNRRTRKPVSHS